jgi:DNA invertase Pin-like site-specific DNA recombinase
MRKAINRKDMDVVMVWSVDRLGRSLSHLLLMLEEMKAKGVDLYLHQQFIDTTTPSGKLMFQMVGAFAEFERAMIRSRVYSGLARAKAQGTRSGKPIGRPRVKLNVEADIKKRLLQGHGMTSIAKELHVGVCTVTRVKRGMEQAGC